ncbi:hypothetical protein BDY19DRAFT_562368 [Irpex rosettiformis]|uniref:Uncharacterized protein n=1 Tax=Irpex rosettiformis TaxID=378272 RepID=A0ACB8TQK5_9APHY|nr:hypothetical protein BDY19DRAFT_562368 [Irpex rosettiformis]
MLLRVALRLGTSSLAKTLSRPFFPANRPSLSPCCLGSFPPPPDPAPANQTSLVSTDGWLFCIIRHTTHTLTHPCDTFVFSKQLSLPRLLVYFVFFYPSDRLFSLFFLTSFISSFASHSASASAYHTLTAWDSQLSVPLMTNDSSSCIVDRIFYTL